MVICNKSSLKHGTRNATMTLLLRSVFYRSVMKTLRNNNFSPRWLHNCNFTTTTLQITVNPKSSPEWSWPEAFTISDLKVWNCSKKKNPIAVNTEMSLAFLKSFRKEWRNSHQYHSFFSLIQNKQQLRSLMERIKHKSQSFEKFYGIQQEPRLHTASAWQHERKRVKLL